MAGIVYNGLRPLDLAHDKSDRTKIRGGVKTLTSIPYDYKDKNPGLFVDTGIQSTAELYSQDGSGKFFRLILYVEHLGLNKIIINFALHPIIDQQTS